MDSHGRIIHDESVCDFFLLLRFIESLMNYNMFFKKENHLKNKGKCAARSLRTEVRKTKSYLKLLLRNFQRT